MSQGSNGLLSRISARLEQVASRQHVIGVLMAVLLVLYLPSLWLELSGDMAYMAGKFLEPRLFPFDTPWSPFSQFTMGKAGDAQSLTQAVNHGLLPWWTSPSFHFQLWRPLAEWTHFLDFKAFGQQAWLMHLHQLVWVLALLGVVKALYERVFNDRSLVVLSLVFFILSVNFAQAFSCLDGRNTVMASVFGFAALLLHMEADQRSSIALRALSCVAFGAALLSSELGLGASAWLFSWSLWMDRAPLWQRFLKLVPFGLIMLAWAWVYASKGYGVMHSEMYIDPVRSPGDFLHALAGRYPLLLLQSFTSLPLTLFTSGKAASPEWWFALIFIAAMAVLVSPFLKQPVWRFLTLAALLATLPLAAGPGGGRTLAFVSTGLVPLIVTLLLQKARAVDLPALRARLTSFVLWPGVVMLFLGFLLIPSLSGLYLINHQKNVSGPAASLPVDDPAKILVLVNPNSVIFTKDYQSMRRWQGLPLSERFYPLGSGQTPMTLTRDGDSLIVKPDAGFMYNAADFFMRPKREKFSPGHSITHGDLTADILEVSPDGRPLATRFSLGKPLESASVSWVICDRGNFVPLTLPPDGGSIRLLPCERQKMDSPSRLSDEEQVVPRLAATND